MLYDEFKREDAENWLNSAKDKGILSDKGTKEGVNQGFNTEKIKSLRANPSLYPESFREKDGFGYFIAKQGRKRALLLFPVTEATVDHESGRPAAGRLPEGFEGLNLKFNDLNLLFCPLDHKNAESLRRTFPFTSPSPLNSINVTFGVGDRLGIAGPGHIRIFKKYSASPVLAQQSVRELTLTGRTYEDVLDASTWAVFQEGYDEPWGADGDHLKTEDWVEKSLALGFTMLTADVSDYIHGEYASKNEKEVTAEYGRIDSSIRENLESSYLNYRLQLENGEEVHFDNVSLARIVLIYRDSLEHAYRLYSKAVETAGEGNFDFELSIDETDTPTTPEAHLFIAKEAEKRGIKIASLAPRFVGEFQKAIDYIGETDKFEKSFKTHALIAKKMGYRISVHSGSDKFKVFPIIGKQTEWKFHIKTAGTNWLEAVRVIALKDPGLFREVYVSARANYKAAREYYHITPNLGNLPDIKQLADRQLPNILDNPDARQVIHITYGEMLKNDELKKKIYACLEDNIEDYWSALYTHIGRHLKSLGIKTKE
ncbi:MAG: hypothetical protein J7K04_14905 [Spirochaetales bacterium]|nr:hypothetical protein [Spirochaetales bacterium]